MTESACGVKVGVWGLGRHARRKILPALTACPDTNLVGVTTRDHDVARSEAAHHGCHAWPSPEAMLGANEVDVVYVATPTGLHHEHGMEVLKAGKHLWCEKALADTLPRVQELVRESHARELALCEGLMYLYHPQFSFIAKAVAARSFGRVLSVTCQFGLPHLEQPGFRFTRELGGGALLDLATYPVSAALRLLGSGPDLVKSVVVQPPGFEVDTHGSALMSSEDGACAFLEWGYDRAYKNEISVWGENASLYSDFIFSKPLEYEARVSVRDEHGEVTHEDIEPTDSFCEMFRAFAKAVNDPALREGFRKEAEAQATYLESLRRDS